MREVQQTWTAEVSMFYHRHQMADIDAHSLTLSLTRWSFFSTLVFVMRFQKLHLLRNQLFHHPVFAFALTCWKVSDHGALVTCKKGKDRRGNTSMGNSSETGSERTKLLLSIQNTMRWIHPHTLAGDAGVNYTRM